MVFGLKETRIKGEKEQANHCFQLYEGLPLEKLKGLRVTSMQSGSYKNFLTVVRHQNEPLSECSHWLQGSVATEQGAAMSSLPLRFMSKLLFPYSH